VAFLNEVQQFEEIEEGWRKFSDPVQYYYKIGNFTVCLSFASTVLVPKITPALNHILIQEPLVPDLTVCLWDTTSEKKSLPAINWNLFKINGYRGYHQGNIYLHYFDFIDAISLINVEKNRAYYIVRHAEMLPWWVSASPLQVILHCWLQEKGLQLTHSAAISNGTNGILLTGKGGSGKSTTVLSCVREGLYYLGEDYCILEPSDPPNVHSIYQSAKWDQHTRKLFPDYENVIMNPLDAVHEKALAYYQDFSPTKIKKYAPITAAISLKIGTQSSPIIKKYSKVNGLKDLSMSTLMQLPLCDSRALNVLKNFCDKVAHYQLTLGYDIQKNVRVLKNILEGDCP
jgi:hypothetical protein